MAHYHLYHLDDCRLVGSAEIEANADEDAVQIAKANGKGDHVEIWEGSRRVRVVAPLASR